MKGAARPSDPARLRAKRARGDPALCFGIGERPRLVAASVAELLAARLPAVPDRIASGSHP
jgi:hypothetical protein